MSEIVLFTGVNNLLGFCRYAGTYRLASELRNSGFSVQTIDFFGEMSPDDVYRTIDVHVGPETLWVGISTTLMQKYMSDEDEDQFWMGDRTDITSNLVSKYNELYLNFLPYDNNTMLSIFNRIKTINPKTQIVIGGYKSLNRGQDYPGVDYWIAGQGEGPSVALSRHLKYNEPLTILDTDIGKVLTDKMYQYDNFSTATIDWHKSDHIFPGEDLPIEFARGCIFKCSFCAFPLNGKKFGDYTRAAESLREELMYNYKNFGTTGYIVSDDTINDSMKKVEYLHKVFTSLPFKARLTGYLRLDIIAAHPQMIKMLKDIGMSACNFGIETFNREAGKSIGKGADPELMKETLFRLREEWSNDIFTTANFIVGLPKESKESIRETFNWLHRPDVPLHGINVSRLYIAQYPTTIQKPNLVSHTQMVNYGFVRVKGGWQYTNTSKIQNNPEKYDFQYGDEMWWQWKSKHMTAEEAEALTTEFYTDPRNQTLKMNFVYPYSRLYNLGYKKNDILLMDQNQYNVVKELLFKTRELRKDYVNKICENPSIRLPRSS